MKVPGGAWLELRVSEGPAGADGRPVGSHLDQRAVFFPRGLAGRAYWYSILPFHGVVFQGMITNITGAAEREMAAVQETAGSAGNGWGAGISWGKGHEKCRRLIGMTSELRRVIVNSPTKDAGHTRG